MRYPVVLHKSEKTGEWGVSVPDLPGCISGGNTMEEALTLLVEAINLHLAGIVEDGDEVPLATEMDQHVDDPDYEGGVWALVDIDVTPYLGKTERFNVTLPGGLVRRIDALVSRDPRFESRSALLARGAERILAESRG